MAVPTVAAITARLSWIPCSCAERVSTSVATILVSPWLSGGLRAVRPANSAPTARQVQVRAARGFCVAAGPHGGKATPARGAHGYKIGGWTHHRWQAGKTSTSSSDPRPED